MAVTGKSVEDVKSVREETGKSYGIIAKEEGKLEEFKKMRLNDKKEDLDAKVKSGQIT